eukprot:COSAG01_NODE_5412_length_4279_cov_5.089474_3_plen_205_part_00
MSRAQYTAIDEREVLQAEIQALRSELGPSLAASSAVTSPSQQYASSCSAAADEQPAAIGPSKPSGTALFDRCCALLGESHTNPRNQVPADDSWKQSWVTSAEEELAATPAKDALEAWAAGAKEQAQRLGDVTKQRGGSATAQLDFEELVRRANAGVRRPPAAPRSTPPVRNHTPVPGGAYGKRIVKKMCSCRYHRSTSWSSARP